MPLKISSYTWDQLAAIPTSGMFIQGQVRDNIFPTAPSGSTVKIAARGPGGGDEPRLFGDGWGPTFAADVQATVAVSASAKPTSATVARIADNVVKFFGFSDDVLGVARPTGDWTVGAVEA